MEVQKREQYLMNSEQWIAKAKSKEVLFRNNVFFLPDGGVAEERERLMSEASQASPRSSAGGGASETRLCAAPTRGNPRSEVPPPKALAITILSPVAFTPGSLLR